MRLDRGGRSGLRYRPHSEPDTFHMLTILPYILVPLNELQATMREAREKAAAAEQRRVLW